MPNINPNSDRDYLESVNIEDEHHFPLFLKKIKFEPFRHIRSLELNFIHPVSIITGTNRIGKTTILMAIACSHLKFKKKNPKNGHVERQTWSDLMKFTSHDVQNVDWNYWITYKRGNTTDPPKRGQRKYLTKKWNGIGKKESQIDRDVIFIDIDRVLPIRNYNDVIFQKSKNATLVSLSNVTRIQQLISYVLEENFNINIIKQYLDKVVLKFENAFSYSSFNSASGEDVVSRLIIDMVEAPKHSMILIDEIEIGLHPRVQRRLVDVINSIARHDDKQFVITTHSPIVLSAFSKKSRIFIEHNNDDFRSIPNISVNAAFSKMDSKSYPLIDLYCEDEVAKKIIKKAIESLQVRYKYFDNLINIIISGSADKTFENFKVHKRTYCDKRIKTGYCCILDGDMKSKANRNGQFIYPPEDELLFLFSDEAPEKSLVKKYLQSKPDPNLSYHVQNSNQHCLFEQMVQHSLCASKESAFDLCWDVFAKSTEGINYLNQLKHFLINMCRQFSPDL